MPAIRKTFSAKVTATLGAGDPEGTFEAIVAVFGNTDTDGDIVERGAFKDSLAAWAAKSAPIPTLWSHQHHDVDAFIGHFIDAKETAQGLWVKGILDLEHPRAARIYQLMMQELITEFSWSGEVLEYEIIEPEEPDDWFWAGIKMLKIDLWEAGPCFKGANRETELQAIKSSDFAGALGERIRRQAKAYGLEPTMIRPPAEPPAAAPVPDAEPVAAPQPLENDVEATTDPAPLAEPAEGAPALPEDVRPASAATKARALLELTTITD